MLRSASLILASALVLAGCGRSGSSGGAGDSPAIIRVPSTTPAAGAPSASGSPADAATLSAISNAYATFFGSKSTVTQSQAALQYGAKFHATLVKEGNSSFAQNSSAKVSSARLLSPNVAAVTFTVTEGGSALLPNAPGYAVKTGDTWQVAAQTFCGLVKLEGDAPAACDDPAVTALPH